ncbi:hypothetical protein [Arthrobacter bambusae]|uniref:SMODS and SLOG-associating 2TM effector domain-containing protein n=1 Tax=Arthrobacter bambusae TaxID=1338426 RepID=A0AAW8D2W6_9MICC|nr:hypothetical protein [Arthrobacter bambusae]MDP9903236.1 hypothetical protein [Arthrobacter bambusae]MDQ0128770.1 hypothetical protein [Arthrobacter bambusae]MDQ0180111.1 hypothetical protein [Arthrobacter bambusae]
MNETSPALPPVYLNIPVREGRGKRWADHLNRGLSAAELSPITEALDQIRKSEEKQDVTALLHFVAFVTTIAGLSTMPWTTPWDDGGWIGIIIGACIAVTATCISAHLSKRISRCSKSVITATEPLMDRLIDFRNAGYEFSSLVRELERKRIIANKNTTPAVQAAFLQALSAIAEYAEQAKIRPDLELARVASAKHLHNDPAVKAIAEKQKAATKANKAARIAARTAVKKFTQAAEDAETLRIAHAAYRDEVMGKQKREQ